MAGGGTGLDRLKPEAVRDGCAAGSSMSGRKAWSPPVRPLALLSRPVALLLLFAALAACLWNTAALETRNVAHESDRAERLDRGERVDMDLYRIIDRRVAAGEDYYPVAAEEHRAFGFPTRPFVAVRTPVLAWTTAFWGEGGWRTLAVLLWAANILAWFGCVANARRAERIGAALLAGGFGMVAFIADIPFSHEILAGLMLSLALALSAGPGWLAGLALAVCAVALRELALPFLLAWGAVALVTGERFKAGAIAAAVAALAAGLAVHAAEVAAVRQAGDLVSPGWHGLLGPALSFYGIHATTLLQTLPLWFAGPLGVLPLLGWFAAGGRLGALASLWFCGFLAAVAIFARQENFYWMGLFVPAYGVGLAFVPRALADLAKSMRRRPGWRPTP